MSEFWNPHEPLNIIGPILLGDFKKLVSFCDANMKEKTKREIATQYIGFLVNDASLHRTMGNEMKWYELTQDQRNELVDKLISEWQNTYPNDLKTEYVPYSALDSARYRIIMDSLPDARPSKKARFVQHVAGTSSATARAPNTDVREDDGTAPWDAWFAEEDRIVGDKLQIYSANQLSGTITWEVVLDKHGKKKLVIVNSDSDSDIDED